MALDLTVNENPSPNKAGSLVSDKWIIFTVYDFLLDQFEAFYANFTMGFFRAEIHSKWNAISCHAIDDSNQIEE